MKLKNKVIILLVVITIWTILCFILPSLMISFDKNVYTLYEIKTVYNKMVTTSIYLQEDDKINSIELFKINDIFKENKYQEEIAELYKLQPQSYLMKVYKEQNENVLTIYLYYIDEMITDESAKKIVKYYVEVIRGNFDGLVDGTISYNEVIKSKANINEIKEILMINIYRYLFYVVPVIILVFLFLRKEFDKKSIFSHIVKIAIFVFLVFVFQLIFFELALQNERTVVKYYESSGYFKIETAIEFFEKSGEKQLGRYNLKEYPSTLEFMELVKNPPEMQKSGFTWWDNPEYLIQEDKFIMLYKKDRMNIKGIENIKDTGLVEKIVHKRNYYEYLDEAQKLYLSELFTKGLDIYSDYCRSCGIEIVSKNENEIITNFPNRKLISLPPLLLFLLNIMCIVIITIRFIKKEQNRRDL